MAGYGDTIGGIAHDELQAKYPGAGTFDHLQGQSQASPAGAGISNTLLETIVAGQFNLAASRKDLSLDEVMAFSSEVSKGPFSGSIQDQITAKSEAEKRLTEAQTGESIANKQRTNKLVDQELAKMTEETEAALYQANINYFEGNIKQWEEQVRAALVNTDIRKGKYSDAVGYALNYKDEFDTWMENQTESEGGPIQEIIDEPRLILDYAVKFMIYKLAKRAGKGLIPTGKRKTPDGKDRRTRKIGTDDNVHPRSKQ